MLRFAEEIMLLLLDDESGEFAHIPEWSLRYALAGAVLMDIALENRIDTDPKRLTLLDPTPIGDDLLDPTLESIAQSTEVHDICHWIEHSAESAYSVRDKAMKRLITHGILESRDDRFLWVFRSRRYPVVDGKAEREVKLRIMEVLFSDVIPDPRDIVIICLADACGIFRTLLSKQESSQAAGRIEQVRKLDLIGQAVSQVVWNIESSLALSMHPIA